jgi:LemA protein
VPPGSSTTFNMFETVAVLCIGLLVWGVLIYNRLVRDYNRVLAAWSDIDVQLKRRHDLIPKLIDAVRRYATYERATVSAVTELRASSERSLNVGKRARLETALGQGLQRLLAVAERYPELKASAGFLALQENLSQVENYIQYARRYYNGAVRNLNTRIDSFPDMVIARPFGFHPREYFELDTDAERGIPER